MVDGRTLICTFYELKTALEPVHAGEKRWVDALHDVWISFGGWSPDSYNFNGRAERAVLDVRRDQTDEGIMLKRMIPRGRFEQWWMDCTTARGLSGNDQHAAEMAYFALCDILKYSDERIKVKK